MAPKRYQTCGKYDGTECAGRWLRNLSFDLEEAGVEETPKVFFQSIDLNFIQEPAKWLDGTPQFRRLTEQTDEPTENDVKDFKRAFKARFSVDYRDELSEETVQDDISNLAQGTKESLSDYYGKAQHLLRRSHARDAPEAGGEPLKPIEKMVVNGVIRAFVRGIRDENLKKTILMRPEKLPSSLLEAYKIAQQTKRRLEQLKEFDKREYEKLEIEFLRKDFASRYDRPLSSVLAEMRRPSHEAYLVQRNHQSADKIGQQPSKEPEQRPTTPQPQKVMHPAGQKPQDSLKPSFNISNDQRRAQLEPQKYNQGGFPSKGNYTGHGNGTGRGGGRMALPPKHLSRHPLINGTEVYRREIGPLCLQCGEVGHSKAKCSSKPIEGWEQTYLRELVYPPASSNSAGLRYRDIEDSKWNTSNWRRENSRPEPQVEENHQRRNQSEIPEEITFTEFSGGNQDLDDHQFMQGYSISIGFCGNDVIMKEQASKRNVKFEENNIAELGMLDSFLNIGETNKRARPLDIHSLLNHDEQDPKIQKRAAKRERRAIRHLREIVGRQGKGPFDYKKLAEEIKVEVTLMDLFQISPDLSKAFRGLSTRVNKKFMKTRMEKELHIGQEKSKRKSSSIISSEVLSGKAAGPSLNSMEKAFRVPISVRTKKNGELVKVSLPEGIAQADQGSDMNIVTVGFLRRLGLPMRSLARIGLNGLVMKVADGTSAKLTHYSEFEVGSLGIWRTMRAFVRPFSDSNAMDMHLLLGLPWLHDVDARIRIRDSIIEMGDQASGEKVVRIQGPKLMRDDKHKLILCPASKHGGIAEGWSESESEEESDQESSEESDSEESDFSEDDEISQLFGGKESGK
ncbi:hypothetical protein K3495_g9193 [Podosphaera aphanis]|nr:hypothetical protein K3495_g9193 [Podosphaera aphanis]